MRLLALLVAGVMLGGCNRSEQGATADTTSSSGPQLQAISLFGESLFPPPLPPEVREDREVKLVQARSDYELDPGDTDAIIWYGRRTAYLGDYRSAITIYTEGIEQHPDDARLYRHRGHRFISVRELDRAVADLQRAAELVAGRDDEVEPDGLPNARNIPTSTLQSNIWYHLGLAHYLKGEFESALRAYRECIEVSGNPDMLVATSHWLYTTLRRLDMETEAGAVLEPIDADMDVIENDAYHQLLLMYKGELDPQDLLQGTLSEDGIENAALAYGIGAWYLYNGELEQAVEIFRTVLSGSQWSAFGYIAAEADLQRLVEAAA
jgi:tetratricopeptide (TPR) repeat protein